MGLLVCGILGLSVPAFGASGSAALSARDRAQLQVLVGEVALQRGRLGRAVQAYGEAAVLAHDPAVAKRALRLAEVADNRAAAAAAARQWARAAPRSTAARAAEVRTAIAIGQEKRVLEAARALIRLSPDGAAGAFPALAAVFATSARDPALALRLMRRLAAAYPNVAQAHFAVGTMQLFDGKPAQALKSANRAIALNDGFLRSYLLEARAWLAQGAVDRADTLMRARFQAHPDDLSLRLAYGRMLADTGHLKRARQAFEAVLAKDQGNADARFALGLLDIDAGDAASARKRLRAVYGKGGEHRNAAAFYLGRIAEAEGQEGLALKWYGRVSGGPHALDGALSQARVAARLGRLGLALGFLQELRRHNPQLAPRLDLAAAQLLFQAGHYQRSIRTYDRAMRDNPDAPELLYGRALAEVRAGQVAGAEADLRHLITLHPKNAAALNALGYVLTNHSSRYREALGYIRRALALRPHDPAIIDSMGWVQYRLGHLKRAHAYLKRAFDAVKPPDAEIAAHLGEVLWKLGDRAGARRVWKAGLAASPGNTTIQKTMKRLTE